MRKSMGYQSVCWLLLFTVSVFGQAAVDQPSEALPLEEVPLTQAQKKMQKIVSVEFRQTPFEEVARVLSEQADINIVMSPAITGEVTATLVNVPLSEAMDNILAVHGYGFMTTENVVRIVPQSELQTQLVFMKNKMFQIKYAEVASVVKSLQEVISNRGYVASDAISGTVLVSDTESQFEIIEPFIEEMDKEIPQILVEARIYDIQSSDSLDLGFEWFAGRRTFIDSDTGEIIGGDTDPFISGSFNSGITQASRTESLLRFGILNENIDLDVLFTAAQDNVNAKLLANPKVLALNNQEASIKIISEIPYQELTQTMQGGNIGTTSFKEVGIELAVTPHITRDEKVRLRIKPSFSVVTGSVPIIIPTVSTSITTLQPVIDKREATTVTLIKSGQTVVIGGLRKKDTLKETSKIPLLGDLPLLGVLFRFEGEKVTNSELVIFITPSIVEEPILSTREGDRLMSLETEIGEPESPVLRIDPYQPLETE